MLVQSARAGEFGRGLHLALALIHGTGVALCAALLVIQVVLAARLADPWLVTAASLWGAAALFRYLSSVFLHALEQRPSANLFRVMDHAGEYFLAAAVLAPLCLGPGRSFAGWLILGLAWAFAVLGILFSSIMFGRLRWLPLILLLSFDWLAILLLPGFYTGSPEAFALSFAGALTWLVGSIAYPEEEHPAKHLLWHVLSLAGTILLGLGAVFALRGFP